MVRIRLWECEDCGKRWGRPLNWHSCMGGVVGEIKNVKQVMVDIDTITYQEKEKLQKQVEDYVKTMVELNHETRKSPEVLVTFDDVKGLIRKIEVKIRGCEYNIKTFNLQKYEIEGKIQSTVAEMRSLESVVRDLKDLIGEK